MNKENQILNNQMGSQVDYYSWEDMDQLHRKVARSIRESNYAPDVIVGVLRCGLVSAIHLAYVLGVDEVGTIKVRTTPSDEILVDKNVDPVVESTMPESLIKNKKVLLVDSVMASGTSVSLSINELSKYEPSEIRLAIIVDWPSSPYSLKVGEERPKIDYIGTTSDFWPDFPWEH